MQGLRIYDQLLQFPLFQGMSHDDLEIVAGHIRFGFVKIAAGKQVVSAGDACNQLFFLINGFAESFLWMSGSCNSERLQTSTGQ